MISLQKDIKKIISTLKNVLYNKADYDKFDIINNSNISIEYLTSDGGFNYQIDFYKYVIELDVKYFSDIEKKHDIKKIEEELCELLGQILKDESEQISYVVIKPMIMNYVNWFFITDLYDKESFINDIKRLKEILHDTSIGKYRIENLNGEYIKTYNKVNEALTRLDLDNPNTFKNLWEAYNYWKVNLDDYAKRRVYFSNLYEELFKIIMKSDNIPNINMHLQYTGWSNINKIIADIKKDFVEANSTPQFNGIGAMCRNVYNCLADEVYKEEYHTDSNTPVPVGDKYKNKLMDYIAYKLNGSTNEDFRSYCKKTVDLADTLTHKMTATKQQAALTITSLISVVNIIEILENSSIIL
ncbi:MAG TPA: hypothetical protein GXZ95_00560 [Mollicutes bacterium]|nr:hypothetical protein [Mollicutes bacterium]